MTKKDLVDEIVDELINRQIMQDKDRIDAISLMMHKMIGFTVWANAYPLEND